MKQKRNEGTFFKALKVNKKGNAIADSLLFIVAVVAMAMFSMIGYVIFNEINTDLQADATISDEAKNISAENFAKYPSIMDSNFIFFLILFWVFAIVSSFVIKSHPIFFVLAMIVLVLIVVIGAILANAYDDMMLEPEFATLALDFPMTNFIMAHFLLVVVSMMGTIMLALYAKMQIFQ